jgi:hypothetical protein
MFPSSPRSVLLRSFVAAIAGALVLTGCSTLPSTPDRERLVTSTSGLVRQGTDRAAVYTLPASTPRPRFSSVYIAPIQLIYTNPEMTQEPQAELQRLANYFSAAIKRRMTEAKIPTASGPGPNVLEVRLFLSDIHPSNPLLNTLQFMPVGIALDVGGVTIESGFIDGSSGKPIAVALVEMTGARKLNPSTVMGRWGDVENAFDEWSAGFTERMKSLSAT